MLWGWVGGAYAFTPTPEQIEQFRQLPREEQERLARQYGVDLNQLMPAGGVQAPAMPADTPNQRKMRGQPDSRTDDQNVVTFPTEDAQEPEQVEATDAETALKPYGYDLFSNNATAFQPNVDIPVPADYVVGPGDTFVVQLYGKDNASHSLSVSREGVIQLPEIGPIALAGLRFSEAQGVIERTISEQMIGVKCSVTMGTLRTIRVFVLGEAVQPGSYIVGSLSTMTNALFASGGVTPIGSLRSIQLKRQGEIVTTLDLYDLLLNGDTRDDARLLPGDVIFIPPVGATVGVSGEVRRPALYEIKHEKSAADLVRLAGGFMPTAYPPASRIERISTQGERTVVNIDLARAEGKNLAVKTGDVLRIFSVLDTMENIVTVEGHVKRPGINAWKHGAGKHSRTVAQS
ncbi:MAG: SLBB domain-containing protein [Pseudomonadota bacterium]